MVALNNIAWFIINEVRGQHPTYVFAYHGKPITKVLSSGWKKTRKKVDLDVRVHDLRHTFGRRLRAAGVGLEDRQDYLGHKSDRITIH